MAPNRILCREWRPLGRSKVERGPHPSYRVNEVAGAHQPPGVMVGLLGAMVCLLVMAGVVRASTYVVFVALDDPVYDELEKLNGLGLLDDYLTEVKPIARVEAARLILEAEQNLDDAEQPDPLARAIIGSLRDEFHEEIQWLEDGHEDNPPTMFHPLERVEGQYIYSSGTRRRFPLSQNTGEFQAQEATPLLPNNDGIATSPGSNEIFRASSWGGLGGFMAAYGETAIAGPLTRDSLTFGQSFTENALYKGSPAVTQTSEANRINLLRGGVVASFGNQALAFGYQEMAWGTGYFNSLAQGDNARPFPALTFESVHPSLLPGFLRYLGPYRHQVFIGKLGYGRYDEALPQNEGQPLIEKNYPYPWISGQVIAFKPLPTFEIGFDHVIMFGGTNNNNYSALGWLGRATGLDTGTACQSVPVPGAPPGTPAQCVPGTAANTNSRGGIFLKIYVPRLRSTQVYQEILGEDNLSAEVRPIGGALPFLSVSYQGGVYIPRVTADGLTDARFEYAIIEPNYSRHDDSLYWANYGQLMADPLGPDSTEVDLSVGRWFNYRYKGDVDVFYTERAPLFGVPDLDKEHGGGIAFDVLQIPNHMDIQNLSFFGSLKVRTAFEYVHDINWERDTSSFRTMVMISGALWPAWPSLIWH
jgi:Capsule assembly protein Wzi